MTDSLDTRAAAATPVRVAREIRGLSDRAIAWIFVAPTIFLLLATGGLFRSLQFTSLNTLVFADVPPEKLSAATSFYSTLQQLSPALGVVLATATLELSRLVAGRAELGLADFSTGFLVAAVVTLLSTPLLATLARDAGAEVSGHVPRNKTQ